MIADATKEKLNLLRLYLAILVASIIAGMIWLLQNFDIIPLYKISCILLFIFALILASMTIEKKIHRLINSLETL